MDSKSDKTLGPFDPKLSLDKAFMLKQTMGNVVESMGEEDLKKMKALKDIFHVAKAGYVLCFVHNCRNTRINKSIFK